MDRGWRSGLKIIAGIVAVMLAAVVAGIALMGRSASRSQEIVAARAAAFCAGFPIGADIANAASSPRRAHVVPLASGGAEYRHRFMAGAYQEAECRITVDARGNVVARRSGLLRDLPHDAGSAASAPLSG